MADLPPLSSGIAPDEARRPLGDISPTAWLPPLRLERQEIFPHPAETARKARGESQTASLASTCTGFDTARSAFTARRLKPDKKSWIRDRPLTDRPSSKRRGCCPGALGWLYREPENDAQRQSHWIQSCPGAEKGLREELRTPVRSVRGTPREANSERGHNLDVWLKEISRYRPPDDRVVQAARRRQQRLKEVGELESAKSSVWEQSGTKLRTAKPQAAAHEQNLLPPETGEQEGEPPPVEPLETGISGRSRGYHGMVGGSGRFSKLAGLCQATPFDTAAGIKHVAGFVAGQASSEEERAWMFFCWVCFHMCLDCDDFSCKSPEHILPERVAGSWSVAKLFAALCAHLNLSVKVVPGYIRGASSMPGDDICADKCNRHWWNVILLGNEWTLVDCACGAASEVDQLSSQSRSFSPYFFGPAPKDFAFSHFPTEARWQLLPEPLSDDGFINQVHASPGVFSASGLEFLPEDRPQGIIRLNGTNMGSVQMSAPSGQVIRAFLGGEEAPCFVASSRQMNLRITVVGATSLKNTDCVGGKNDASDPYCVCQILGRREEAFRTEVAMNKLNPKWNQTFDLTDLQPGETLQFKVYDKDLGKKDDELGDVSVATGQFFVGGSFEGELDLVNDGAMNSKLRLRIQPLSVSEVRSTARDRGTVAIYFRAPNVSGEHPLEVYTAQAGSSHERLQRACVFKVVTIPDPLDFTLPCFPEIFKDAFQFYGLDFVEALPNGRHNLDTKNEIEVCLHKTVAAPAGLQVVADVDGDRSAAIAHVSGGKVVIRAQAPPGDHILTVSARRDGKRQFARVVSYQLHVPENCSEVLCGGFVQLYDAYRELGAMLDAPVAACLQPGLHRLRLRLPKELSDAKVALSVGSSRETINIPLHSDGTFEGDAHISPPEATLLCASPGGELRPLLRWTVGDSPTAVPPLARRNSNSQLGRQVSG